MNANGSSKTYNPSSDLFTDRSGDSLHIFVEPAAVVDRPRLIRYIKMAGASLERDPHDAQIVLVDGETDAGREVIRQWDEPSRRVILDVDWAWVALRRNKVALWSEGWNGFRLRPDNTNDSETIHHPLPTPRRTPSEFVADRAPTGRFIPGFRPTQTSDLPSTLQTPGPSTQLPFHPFAAPIAAGLAPTSSSGPTSGQQYFDEASFAAFLQGMGSQITVPATVLQSLLDVFRHGCYPEQPSPANVEPTENTQSVNNGIPAYPRDSAPNRRIRSLSLDSAHILPSLKRRHDEEPSARSKGKKKAARLSPEPQYYEDNADTVSQDEETEPMSQRSPRQGRPRQPDAVFTSDTGDPLDVYVQVGLHSRKYLVDVIKKNGGRIVSNISDAVYVILSPRDKSCYAGFLHTCQIHNKPPLTAEFIRACVAECMLLDVDPFLLEDVSVVKRYGGRGRPSKPVAVNKSYDAEQYRPIVKQEETTPRKNKLVSNKHYTLDRRPTSRSPSPEPPTEPKKYTQGKHFFTAEEFDYMFVYLRKLFKRDPTAAYGHLSKKMHEKMPQHPVNSWNAALRKKMKEVEDVRKKVAIQIRKTEDAAFGDIVNWFVEGNADLIRDEDVWPALGFQYSYKNEREWQAFWSNGGQSITREVTARRSRVQAAEIVPKSEPS